MISGSRVRGVNYLASSASKVGTRRGQKAWHQPTNASSKNQQNESGESARQKHGHERESKE
jgi:hypothetical protein